MRNKIINSINKNSDKSYVVDRGKIVAYYKTLKSDLLHLNAFFEYHEIKKILIKLPQGFQAYSLIIAAYLSNVCFCVIDEFSCRLREEHFLSQYKPDIVFGVNNNSLNCDCQYIKYEKAIEFFDPPRCVELCDEFWYDASQELAYVLFTSGTTGMPKGCCIKRKSIETFIEKASNIFNLESNDVYGQYAPLFFDMSMLDVFLCTSIGATLVPFSTKVDKLRPGSVIQQNRITFINAVPQMIEILKRGKQLSTAYLSSLRAIKLGGDKVRKDIVKDLFECTNIRELFVTYGPTEATVFCMINKLSKDDWFTMEDSIVPLGSNIEGYSGIDIINDEIVVKGICVAQGYLDGTPGGFCELEGVSAYRTGDYAVKKEGRLLFSGREDSQYKINGVRIDLSEVELAFSKYCVAAHALCINENIVVFVISTNAVDYLQRIIAEELPQVLQPRVIIKVDDLPKLSNGKIDNKKLLDIYGA